jgi:hypothetical protein
MTRESLACELWKEPYRIDHWFHCKLSRDGLAASGSGRSYEQAFAEAYADLCHLSVLQKHEHRA